MILFNRFWLYFSSLSIVISFFLWVNNPDLTYYIAGYFFVIHTLTIWLLAKFGQERKTFFTFYFTPFFLLAGAFTFFLIIDHVVVQHLFALVIGIIYMLITRNIFSFVYKTKDYQPLALENIFSYINLISLFLFYSSFYGFLLLLGWPVWLFVIICFVITAFLFTRTLLTYKIQWTEGKLFVLIMSIIITECFYVINLLPSSYIINGLVLVVVYYLFMNLIKDYLKERLNMKDIRLYLSVVGIILVISLLTTRWY
ncbi:MAG: hypothetical protein ACNFW9_01665 [Candidatus Kerfeldbacteria bacterium]